MKNLSCSHVRELDFKLIDTKITNIDTFDFGGYTQYLTSGTYCNNGIKYYLDGEFVVSCESEEISLRVKYTSSTKPIEWNQVIRVLAQADNLGPFVAIPYLSDILKPTLNYMRVSQGFDFECRGFTITKNECSSIRYVLRKIENLEFEVETYLLKELRKDLKSRISFKLQDIKGLNDTKII